MKKLILLILLLFPFILNAADVKMTDLTEDTTPTSDDIFWTTNAPGTVPADRKVTLGNLLLWMATQNWTVTGTWDLSGATVTFGLVDADIPDTLTIAAITLADSSAISLPVTAPGSTMDAIVCDETDNSCAFIALGEYAAVDHDHSGVYLETGDFIETSVITGEGVVVGTAADTAGFVAKPASPNNTFFGYNNAGTLGFYDKFTRVMTAAPDDLGYSGDVITMVNGEATAITFGQVVYCKGKAGVPACYKYDANGADKALPPRYMVVSASIESDASGTFLRSGTVRNDAWTTDQAGNAAGGDEGKIVYAAKTAGETTITIPATSGDMVFVMGTLINEKVIDFRPSLVGTEVP
jgi:hypothetical protein